MCAIGYAIGALRWEQVTEAKLMDGIRPVPGAQDYDTNTFVLTSKVACDCKVSTAKSANTAKRLT